MTVLIYGHDRAVARFVSEQVSGEPDMWLRDYAAIGVARNGKLCAGVVYSHYNGHDLQLSIAATDPRWATRRAIRALLAYPYTQLGLPRTTLIQSVTNDRARKLAEGLGYRPEGVLRQGWFGREDALVLGALRSDVERWL